MSAPRCWTWRKRRQEHGVDLFDDHLNWWSAPPQADIRFAGGAAADQSLSDYRKRGPLVGSLCPAAVKAELDDILGDG